MIKRSSILLLFLLLGSVTYLVYASAKIEAEQMPNTAPVKCSEKCEKAKKAPVQWNMVTPTVLYTES